MLDIAGLAAKLGWAQKQAAREIPRRMGGTYSRPRRQVKENRSKNGPKTKDLAFKMVEARAGQTRMEDARSRRLLVRPGNLERLG